MASITIRRLPENTKRRLRLRAARNGHSMEQEARDLLEVALAHPKREIREPTPQEHRPETNSQKTPEIKKGFRYRRKKNPHEEPIDLGEAIRRRFASFGGVDLKIPPREPIPDPKFR